MNTNNTKLKISVIDDEQDILTLYKDYLISKGHEVFSFLNADNILREFLKNPTDIALMDYKILGHKSGIDAAIEILGKYPLFPILFITAYEQLRLDILNYSIFRDKRISILIKPVFLQDIEDTLLNLVNH
jgi:DNA-binding NtrC family response regulator